MKPVWLPVGWKEQDLKFLCDIHPADPAVGIMGPFVENIREVVPPVIPEEDFSKWLDYDTPEGKALHSSLEFYYYGEE